MFSLLLRKNPIQPLLPWLRMKRTRQLDQSACCWCCKSHIAGGPSHTLLTAALQPKPGYSIHIRYITTRPGTGTPNPRFYRRPSPPSTLGKWVPVSSSQSVDAAGKICRTSVLFSCRASTRLLCGRVYDTILLAKNSPSSFTCFQFSLGIVEGFFDSRPSNYNERPLPCKAASFPFVVQSATKHADSHGGEKWQP